MNDIIIMSSPSLPLCTLAGKYLKVRVTGYEFQNKINVIVVASLHCKNKGVCLTHLRLPEFQFMTSHDYRMYSDHIAYLEPNIHVILSEVARTCTET